SAMLQSSIAGDIKCKRGLTHRRSGGQNDQVGFLEARKDVINGVETRRNASLKLWVGTKVFKPFPGFLEGCADRTKLLCIWCLGSLKNLLLSLIERLIYSLRV